MTDRCDDKRSETPRTDANVIYEGGVPEGVVPAGFARQLEHEMTEPSTIKS